MQNSKTQFSSSKVGLFEGCKLIKLPVDEIAQLKGPQATPVYEETEADYGYFGDLPVCSETYDDIDGGVNNFGDDMFMIDRIAAWNDRTYEWENEVQMFS